MPRLKILFRVDSNSVLGTGHLSECLWLARGAGAEALFCIRQDARSQELIRHYGFRVLALPRRGDVSGEMRTAVKRFQPDVVVVDILDVKNSELRRLPLAHAPLIVLNALFHPVAADAHIATVFSPLAGNRQFSGPRYILLRKSFARARPIKMHKAVKEVLLLFGGADPGNFTTKTLKALDKIPEKFTLNIVLGGSFRNKKAVDKFLKRSRKPRRVYVNIKNDRMLITVMRKNDMAFISGGYTLSELMRLGIPCVALSQNRIEAQRIFKNFPSGAFMNLGAGKNISVSSLGAAGEELIHNFAKRKAMHQKAVRVVDGKGIERVLKIIHKARHKKGKRFN